MNSVTVICSGEIKGAEAIFATTSIHEMVVQVPAIINTGKVTLVILVSLLDRSLSL